MTAKRAPARKRKAAGEKPAAASKPPRETNDTEAVQSALTRKRTRRAAARATESGDASATAAAAKPARPRKRASSASAASHPARETADGRVVITHPDKLMFPDEGITKRELAAYYEAIAPVMLPHIRSRPLTMERFRAGVGEPGFLQKNTPKGAPAWLARVEVPKKDGTVCHPLINDTRSLVWMANQNCITPHVWISREPDLLHPDVCVFDLDPTDDEKPSVLRAAALALRDLLSELDLTSWVKTSGSKGFHIVVPLDGKSEFGEVFHFAHDVGTRLVSRDPKHLTQEFAKADRGGRILVDTGRNGYSATFAATYAVRARPGAPISAPCTWDELAAGDVEPRTFTLRGMAGRIADVGDLWADIYSHGHSLRRAKDALKRLQSA